MLQPTTTAYQSKIPEATLFDPNSHSSLPNLFNRALARDAGGQSQQQAMQNSQKTAGFEQSQVNFQP